MLSPPPFPNTHTHATAPAQGAGDGLPLPVPGRGHLQQGRAHLQYGGGRADAQGALYMDRCVMSLVVCESSMSWVSLYVCCLISSGLACAMYQGDSETNQEADRQSTSHIHMSTGAHPIADQGLPNALHLALPGLHGLRHREHRGPRGHPLHRPQAGGVSRVGPYIYLYWGGIGDCRWYRSLLSDPRH